MVEKIVFFVLIKQVNNIEEKYKKKKDINNLLTLKS